MGKLIFIFIFIFVTFFFISSWFFPKKFIKLAIEIKEVQKKINFIIAPDIIDHLNFDDDPFAIKWFYRILLLIIELVLLITLMKII
jgi:hypothetical protein